VKQQAITHEPHLSVPEFRIQLSSTGRGARLARTLAVQQLTEWCGIARDPPAVGLGDQGQCAGELVGMGEEFAQLVEGQFTAVLRIQLSATGGMPSSSLDVLVFTPRQFGTPTLRKRAIPPPAGGGRVITSPWSDKWSVAIFFVERSSAVRPRPSAEP
jgi:hypothetical protein